MIKHAKEETFSNDIKNGVVLVDFWAEWCGPCKMISPILEELADELKDKVTVVKLDIEQARETINKMGIMSVPTLYVYKDGEKKEETVGFQTKDSLLNLLKPHLS